YGERGLRRGRARDAGGARRLVPHADRRAGDDRGGTIDAERAAVVRGRQRGTARPRRGRGGRRGRDRQRPRIAAQPRRRPRIRIGLTHPNTVIASGAKQSPDSILNRWGLLRRSAPRNDNWV